MYGQLKDNVLRYAPNPIVQDGKRIYNPSDELLRKQGYMPVIMAERPLDGRHCVQSYEQTESEIRIVWVDDDEEYWASIPYEEAVDAQIRKRYSISQEFAILRQKEEKPEEYAAYYDYCERCKAFVKTQKGEIV